MEKITKAVFILSLMVISCKDNQKKDVTCKFFSEFQITQPSMEPLFQPNSNWNFRSVVDPTVVEVGSKYYMWFTGRGYSKFQVGLAISEDGENWYEYSKNPVLTVGDEGDFDGDHIRRPVVIYDEGKFKMWYSGYGKNKVEELHYSIGYAESIDGITWTKYSKNPVIDISPRSWDDIDVMLGGVVRKGEQYYLWYDGLSSSHIENTDSNTSNNIASGGYAYSSDGLNWIKYNAPVFIKEESGFEAFTIDIRGVAWVYGRYFEMFYSGKQLGEDGHFYRSIGRAVSEDGITWTKDPTNPIISHGNENEWNQYSIWFSGLG